jgi:hypothetical protein
LARRLGRRRCCRGRGCCRARIEYWRRWWVYGIEEGMWWGWRWLSWCVWCIGKGVLVEDYVTRDDDAAGSEIETPISFVM